MLNVAPKKRIDIRPARDDPQRGIRLQRRNRFIKRLRTKILRQGPPSFAVGLVRALRLLLGAASATCTH
jgi:hypothetical protein